MITFEKILLSTDFSDASSRALPLATDFARKYGAELHVVHVVEDINNYAHFAYSGLPMDTSEFFEGLYQARSEDLEVYATAMKGSKGQAVENSTASDMVNLTKTAQGIAKDLVVKTHLRRGVPASEVIETAKEIGADLIVLSTHGRTGLSHLLLGSVAERIIRESPIPVLTVPAKKSND